MLELARSFLPSRFSVHIVLPVTCVIEQNDRATWTHHGSQIMQGALLSKQRNDR